LTIWTKGFRDGKKKKEFNEKEEKQIEKTTDEIYDKTTVRSSANRFMEESLTVWRNLRVKCCGHAASI